MSDYRTNTPGDDGDAAQEQDSRPNPVPRDMPDQQTGADEDPWEVDDPAGTEADERPDPEVPDTDEAGTGKRGAAQSGSDRPEQPVPDESPA
ncbi:hypothetical protein GCM10023084_63550 [Streptomyces lacrimifluminis]|uniref:Uncharacterized protein n=1 Tax=Streptomyces lacrimifluminis TaxID=1500077 RepID=A0A917LBV4_9ACTN|nr:hypothetical protein [Streptomyces lacrimifluminis]GGJ57344.1 hypothetical protein GCM10012282_63200 [Streptomyces lacrimifluminis]